jgi:hypothetical protein
LSCTSGKCSFTKAPAKPVPVVVDASVIQKVVVMLTALYELLEDEKVQAVLHMCVWELQGQV